MNILNSHHFLYFLPTTRLVILLAALTTAEDVTNSTFNRTDVSVGSVPMVISRIDHIIVKEGSSALIDCNVQGSPSPHYRWYNSNGRLLQEEENKDALMSSVGLRLVGPYDILAGRHRKAKSTDPNFNIHWRFFYDPPEFQTILVGDSKTQYHMGYFRDVPDELPVWVGANEAKKGCVISQVGDNVFAAVKLFLSKKIKEVTDKKKNALLKDIDEKITRTAKELGYSLEQKTMKMKQRDKKVVTKAFHGAGLVVPVDKNDVGYRELPETNANLKKICKAIVDAPTDDERLKAFAPIQEMLTFVQFANDECDYGMGYELGMDLFCYGSHYFHKTVGQLLPLAYTLLKRNLFAEIIEAHLASRREEKVDQLVP